MSRGSIAAVVAVVLVGGAGRLAPRVLGSHMRAHVRVQPDKVTGALHPGGAAVTVQMRVRTDTGSDAHVVAAQYAVTLADREVGSGRWVDPAGGVLVASGSEATFPLVLDVDGPQLL